MSVGTAMAAMLLLAAKHRRHGGSHIGIQGDSP
jgi:hypothetical protein